VKQVADGVWQLRGFPPNAINVYLAEDVLIDAGTRRSARRILKQVDGRTVRAHALTHAHPDHQGSSDEVCGKLGLEYWVGEKEVPYAERPEKFRDIQSSHPYTRLVTRFFPGPGRNVDRVLHEGMTSPGSRCSRCPATRPATSRSGGRGTGF